MILKREAFKFCYNTGNLNELYIDSFILALKTEAIYINFDERS